MAQRQAWAWGVAVGVLASVQAQAEPPLTAPFTASERAWLEAAHPVLAQARHERLPLDVVVQPQPNAGEPPLATAFVAGRCKLVLTMRGAGGSTLPEAARDAALPAVLLEAMLAHELGHCWRHARGDWHGWPAAFGPATFGTAGDAVEAARREEGFADLVALAWTLQQNPGAYRAVHDWLSAQRARPVHDGAEHDTRVWVAAALDPAAFGAPAPLFERARRLWMRIDPTPAH
ncbi:MAG: hypothetical protein NTW15_11600 [Burkholderiales bacterium]|nr:hypothetical protein [Burkholderiales bacterium]